MSGWDKTRDFINSKDVGYIFARKDLLLLANLLTLRPSTMDTTRNLLVRAGFFKIVKRGKYELLRKIYPGTTMPELFQLAFGSTLVYLEKVTIRKEREKNAK